ncbi:hypothetical protein CERSUDRAFT_123788 [Gelatoporia subvermispora B]|uniref:Uncharacterized protein n=1 Tax=Ceriporiopsis subvermispora (strain B) TaxID=914234 RepID=M2QX44_CERS8|nr:hypothetical protein CERSUDRAFT_123788 [Gelatoporia subvermispora B]
MATSISLVPHRLLCYFYAAFTVDTLYAMNKLRKLRQPTSPMPGGYTADNEPNNSLQPVAQSRTMMYALSASTSTQRMVKKATSNVETVSRFPPAAKPVTIKEQYWAARALTAEALLAARITHTGELRALTEAEQEKRNRELEVVHHLHEDRQSKLERLVLILLACLVLFVAALLYSFVWSHHAPPARHSKPSHFTIPILSPFASVCALRIILMLSPRLSMRHQYSTQKLSSSSAWLQRV